MIQRVLIVGAGLIGANLAFELARRGQPVIVIDAGLPAGAASGRSFGWINASFFLNEDHFRLRHAAIEAHRRLARDLPDSGHRWSGAIWWEEEGAAFDASAEKLTRLGYALQELDQEEVARREPALAAPPARALWFPGDGAVDARHLTAQLLAAASAAGAQVWCGCAAERLLIGSGGVEGVETSMGRIVADTTIVLAGSASGALLATAGLGFPMLSRPGIMLRTKPVPPLIRHILASPDQEFRQDADGAILAPATAGHQSDTTERVTETPDVLARSTLARLARLLPGVTLEAGTVLHSERPVPGDGLPAVGPVAALPGLALAVLHSGVTLAPLVAEALAGELTGQGRHKLLASFAPDRLLSRL